MVERSLELFVEGLYLLPNLFPWRYKQMLQQLYLASGVL
jgi:uncharacterized protein YjeT (DUF2065 family)